MGTAISNHLWVVPLLTTGQGSVVWLEVCRERMEPNRDGEIEEVKRSSPKQGGRHGRWQIIFVRL
jgi:hypothetical protein